MTARRSWLGRFREWMWRGGRLRDLRAQRDKVDDAGVERARSCQTLAWRALSGLEPIPSHTRETVARPLIVAGLRECLPITSPPVATIAELLSAEGWRENLASGGVATEQLSAIEGYLNDGSDRASPGTAERALRLLGAVIESIEGPGRAVNGIYWRRTVVLLAAIASVAAVVAALIVLLTPPEGPDIAVGKPWSTSSFYPGFPASGVKEKNPPGGAFFSTTNEEATPWWSLDLQAKKTIAGVTVDNRSDCCAERAPPLVIEVSSDGTTWREVARQTEVFRTWRATFNPVPARYVRVRALRRTHLHLRDVRVHPPQGSK